MIKLLRVDDRLIHGQVAMTWTSFLGADLIIVANDKVPNDKLLQMTLKLAQPPGIRLRFLSIDDTVKYINDPKSERFKIFIVCDSTDDALKLTAGSEEIQHIIFGGIRKSGDKQLIDRQVFLDENDFDNWKKMEELGRKVRVHVIPSESEIKYDDALNTYRKRI